MRAFQDAEYTSGQEESHLYISEFTFKITFSFKIETPADKTFQFTRQ